MVIDTIARGMVMARNLTLVRCSLVCRAWVSRAQMNLFYEINASQPLQSFAVLKLYAGSETDGLGTQGQIDELGIPRSLISNARWVDPL